jgi:uridine kinase
MTTIVAITGGSGAGKTTIANALARQLGAGAIVIAEDDYYRCASTIPHFDPATHNFDVPDAKEHALLSQHLMLAKNREAFDKPMYDLITHHRMAKVERIAQAKSIIVEGIHLLADQSLREIFDLKVYVDADEALRLGRRMIRDVEERGRAPRAVLAQFFATVRPMHDAHVAPQRAFADLVLRCEPNAGPEQAQANAARVAALLETRAA